MTLVRVAEGFQFRTVPEAAPWIRALNRPKPQRLSQAAVESLALIAYLQPITRGEIESVRGVDTGAVLKTLLDRHLLRVVGRKEEPGRPLLYATNQEFLELFGLKDLSDLPPLSELEEMIKTQSITQEEGKAGELGLEDLLTTPEERLFLDEADRDLLDDLDKNIENLKNTEKTVLTSTAEPSQEADFSETKSDTV